MRKRGMTQAELGRLTGRDAGVVSRWIRAERKPDQEARTLLAFALDIPEGTWDRRPRSPIRFAA